MGGGENTTKSQTHVHNYTIAFGYRLSGGILKTELLAPLVRPYPLTEFL